jgi:hypothetical protein
VRTVERHPDAVDATVDSELVVMNITSLDYYRFNQVAESIWALLQESPLNEEEICRALLDEYEVEEADCRIAVRQFIEDALSRGFLRAVE